MKKGFLSAMATVGYGLVILTVILAVGIGIMVAVNGIGKKDEPITGLEVSLAGSTEADGLFVVNDVFRISTELDDSEVNNNEGEETPLKTYKFKINGKSGEGSVDYSTKKITLRLTKSKDYNDLKPSNLSPILFVTQNEEEKVLTNTITVSVNQIFEVALTTEKMTNPYVADAEEKDYIKGGDVFLQARTTDGLYQAEAQKIEVDVPIETLVITGESWGKDGVFQDLTDVIHNTATVFEKDGDDYKNIITISTPEAFDTADKQKIVYYIGDSFEDGGNIYYKNEYYYYFENKWINLWTQNIQAFIKNSAITLGVKTFPENALKPTISMNKTNLARFSADSLTRDQAILDKETGVFTITGDTQTLTGNLPIACDIPKLIKNNQGYEYISADDMIVRSEPVQIETIEIGNSSVAIDGITFDVFSSSKFSATATSDSSIINLDVRIKSKHYVHGEDPSQGNLENLYLHEIHAFNNGNISDLKDYLSGITDFYKNPYSITQTQQVANKIWNVKTRRELLSTTDQGELYKEVFYINLSFDAELDEFKPSATFQFFTSTTIPTKVEYVGQTILTPTKYDVIYDYYVNQAPMPTEKIEHNSVDLQDFISYDHPEEITYAKWVYFVKNYGTEGGFSNVNVVGSEIIKLTDAGQLSSSFGYSKVLEALGDSLTKFGLVDVDKFQITAMLVLTDENGDPLNWKYDVISVNDETGYIMQADINYLPNDDKQDNKFVVMFMASDCDIQIQEKLEDMSAFYKLVNIDKQYLIDGNIIRDSSGAEITTISDNTFVINNMVYRIEEAEIYCGITKVADIINNYFSIDLKINYSDKINNTQYVIAEQREATTSKQLFAIGNSSIALYRVNKTKSFENFNLPAGVSADYGLFEQQAVDVVEEYCDAYYLTIDLSLQKDLPEDYRNFTLEFKNKNGTEYGLNISCVVQEVVVDWFKLEIDGGDVFKLVTPENAELIPLQVGATDAYTIVSTEITTLPTTKEAYYDNYVVLDNSYIKVTEQNFDYLGIVIAQTKAYTLSYDEPLKPASLPIYYGKYIRFSGDYKTTNHKEFNQINFDVKEEGLTWMFKKGTEGLDEIEAQFLDCNTTFLYNIKEQHDTTALRTTNEVFEQYNIYCFDDNTLSYYYENPGRLDEIPESQKISLEQPENQNYYNLVLKSGWRTEITKKNVVLVHAIRNGPNSQYQITESPEFGYLVRFYILNLSDDLQMLESEKDVTQVYDLTLLSPKYECSTVFDFSFDSEIVPLANAVVSVSYDYEGKHSENPLLCSFEKQDNTLTIALNKDEYNINSGQKVLSVDQQVFVTISIQTGTIKYEFTYKFKNKQNIYKGATPA